MSGNEVGVALLVVSLGRDGGTERSESVEVSYCRVRNLDGHALRWTWATTAGETGPRWIYRCSVDGELGALNGDTVDLRVERCLFTSTEIPRGEMTEHSEHLTVAATDLSASLELPDGHEGLGTHGADIA